MSQLRESCCGCRFLIPHKCRGSAGCVCAASCMWQLMVVLAAVGHQNAAPSGQGCLCARQHLLQDLEDIRLASAVQRACSHSPSAQHGTGDIADCSKGLT